MSQSNLFQKYCIDACAILDFWDTNPKTRPYHVKVKSFRTIWNYIASKVENGSIVIPKIVADEIISGNDDIQELREWLTKHKKIFVEHDFCVAELQIIVNKYQIYTTQKGSFTDAVVIAIGLSSNLVVITSENYSLQHNPVKPKIPNLCDDFGVKWMHLPEFFKEEGL